MLSLFAQGQVIALTLSFPSDKKQKEQSIGGVVRQAGLGSAVLAERVSREVNRPLMFALSSQENFPPVKIPSQTIRQIYDGLIMPQKRITGQKERFSDLRAAHSKCDD